MKILLLLIIGLSMQPLRAGEIEEINQHCLSLKTTDGNGVFGLPLKDEGSYLRFLDPSGWKILKIPFASISPATIKELEPWRAKKRLEFRGLFLGMTRTEVKELIKRGEFIGLDEEGITMVGNPDDAKTLLATSADGTAHHCERRIGIQFHRDMLVGITLKAAHTNSNTTADKWKAAVTEAMQEKYGASKATYPKDPPGTTRSLERWDNSRHEAIYLGDRDGTPSLIYGYTLNANYTNPRIPPPTPKKGNL